MKNKKILNNILGIVISNIIKLVSGIAIAFLIPKILSIGNYGYYKLFVLYLTYAGLFNFGFIDGIYLKYGGCDYNTLDKDIFKLFFKYLALFIILVSFALFFIAFFVLEPNLRLILILLATNLLSVHITGYFQIISQITSRFKEYSVRTIIIAITNLLITLVVFLFNIDNFVYYILMIIFVNYAISLWYIFTYKDIVFGKKTSLRSNKILLSSITMLGMPLLFSNLATTIAINIDKQLVDLLFDIEEFALYSFAYSMLSMITVVVSAVGIVLYPTLKRTSLDNSAKNYTLLNKIVIATVLIGLIGYFPLAYFIPTFLPNYIGAIPIFRIALPGLVFTSAISIVKHNFFKLYNKNVQYLIISVIAIVVNIFLNLSAYYIFGTLVSISISSVIGLSIWYLVTEYQMKIIHNIQWGKNLFFAILGIVCFYATSSIGNLFLAVAIYLAFIIILFYSFDRKEINALFARYFRKN